MPKKGRGGTANNVYIRSDEFAWVPARLVSQDRETAKVAIPQYASEELIMSDGGKGAVGFKSAIVKLKDYPNMTLPLQNTGSDGCLKEVDDMVDLPYLHEVRREWLFYVIYHDISVQICNLHLSHTTVHSPYLFRSLLILE
jgi:hypothetical protein